MAKVFKKWPELEIDKPIEKFLKRRGIDPNDVSSYRIIRPATGMPTIELVIFYDESEPMADASGLDKPPGSELLHTRPLGPDETCTVPNCLTHRPR